MSVRTEQMCSDLVIRLWGKTHGGELGPGHPLLFHMLDAACVTSSLWRRSLSPFVRRRLSRPLGLSEKAAGKWICYLSGLHDAGKASPAFQARSRSAERSLHKMGLPFPDASRAGHGIISTAIIHQWLRKRFCCADDTSYLLAAALGGHHGSFPRAADLHRASLESDLGRTGGQKTAWDDVRSALLETYTDLVGPDHTSASPTHS